MSSKPTNSISDDQAEQLAAYLDGELSPEETQALESRLATDANLRSELGQLQKAWDLLDVLPRAKADETFSTTTMSLAADQLRKEAAARQKKIWTPRMTMITAATLVALISLGAGYLVVTNIVQRPKREMERELHLLSNYVTYQRLSDNYLGEKNLDFLRMLQSSGLFVASETAEAQSKAEVKVEPTSLDSLSPEEKANVIRNYQEISATSNEQSGAKIASMRELAKVIGSDPARGGLLRVYDRYYAWLQALPAADIRKIESERDPAKRLELVRARWRQQSQQNLQAMLADLQVILTAEDYDAFRDWFVGFVAAHEEEIKAKLKDHQSIAMREMDRITDPNRKRMRLYWIYSWRVSEQDAIVPSQEDFNKLTSQLSEEAKQQLSTIETSEEQRRLLISSLLAAAFRAHTLPPATDEDRAKVLASLSPEEREKLEKLKALDLKRELNKRFEKNRGSSSRYRDSEKRESEKKDGRKNGSGKNDDSKDHEKSSGKSNQ
jgi:hypothetical protein